MHPNAFLRTYWRLELRPQVFVAMTFSESYLPRYTRVIEPAVRRLAVNGLTLSAYRVDDSQTGDSVLTDILDGVAHSQFVLADVSVIGRDSVTGVPYRNANVLYEVGLALACRLPEEVLLIRDDREKFLFDVSTVPHLTVDFTDETTAQQTLADALADRLKAQAYARDARVRLALAGLTNSEIALLAELVKEQADGARGWNPGGTVLSVYEHATSRLLDKGVIKVVGVFEGGVPGYALTPLGRQVALEGMRLRVLQRGPSAGTSN
jgi:hypothetical protein